jgi:[ribosomal protein S5]-alanine N-acetyltransferase
MTPRRSIASTKAVNHSQARCDQSGSTSNFHRCEALSLGAWSVQTRSMAFGCRTARTIRFCWTEANRRSPPRPFASERVAELREDVGSPTILETDRLILREVRNSDVDAFQHYMLREAYWRHDPREPPTPESVAALVGRFTRSQSQRPRTDYFLAAVDKRSDEFVGEASLRVRGIPTRQGAIGYGVTSSRVGQGFATEIGRGLLRLAFETLDLHRVDAQCRAENHASRRVMAKLGMREEGVFRDNLFVRGEWWSTVHSAILSTDQSTSPA